MEGDNQDIITRIKANRERATLVAFGGIPYLQRINQAQDELLEKGRLIADKAYLSTRTMFGVLEGNMEYKTDDVPGAKLESHVDGWLTVVRTEGPLNLIGRKVKLCYFRGCKNYPMFFRKHCEVHEESYMKFIQEASSEGSEGTGASSESTSGRNASSSRSGIGSESLPDVDMSQATSSTGQISATATNEGRKRQAISGAGLPDKRSRFEESSESSSTPPFQHAFKRKSQQFLEEKSTGRAIAKRKSPPTILKTSRQKKSQISSTDSSEENGLLVHEVENVKLSSCSPQTKQVLVSNVKGKLATQVDSAKKSVLKKNKAPSSRGPSQSEVKPILPIGTRKPLGRVESLRTSSRISSNGSNDSPDSSEVMESSDSSTNRKQVQRSIMDEINGDVSEDLE